MGILSISCTASTGTRVMGIAYASVLDSKQFTDHTYNGNGYTHVVLVQTNDYPSSIYDVSWSLVRAWQRNITRYDERSPLECHVDPTTGVFTLMSNYSGNSNDRAVQPLYPLPGGFQYDPRTNATSDFTLSADYRWGDVDHTFTLFTWPNATLLHQANIANPSNGTVNLGMLKKNEDGSSTFVNAASWILDPNTYGYPRKLSFGKDSIYQFGSIVANNMTGAFKSFLTRIPLSGPNGTLFNPPTNLSVYEIDNFNNCSYPNSPARFYRDTLYVICESISTSPLGQTASGRTFLFKDDSTGIISINPGGTASTYESNLFQPTSSGENSSVWAYNPSSPPRWMSLDPNTIRVPDFEILISFNANITEPFGTWVPENDPTNLIIYVSIGVSLFLLLAIAIIVWRNWRYVVKFRTQVWPRWKRRIKAKIINIVSKIDEGDDGSKISNVNDSLESGTRYEASDIDSAINKIEEIPMQLIAVEEGHKILVTPDMDLSDLDDAATAVVASPSLAVVDVNAEDMLAVNLDTHPRPAVVMMLSDGSILGNGRLNDIVTEVIVSPLGSENNLRLLRPGRTVSSAPQLHISPEIILPSSSVSRNTNSTSHQEQYATPSEPKASNMPSEDIEDYAPPYIHVDDLSMLPTPSFPTPALPSAPPLEAEDSNVQSGSGPTEYDDTRGGSSR
ncbi:hypothetical protein BGX26_005617 [Mortierella sp. AD094]|nr:hypothetical protein BGX26_005617 [Mortierella sp. AD094]